LIICDDLSDDDLDRAAELAVAGATKNSGQRCTAVKRILCMEKVADAFVAKVLEKAKKIKFGDPMNPIPISVPWCMSRQPLCLKSAC